MTNASASGPNIRNLILAPAIISFAINIRIAVVNRKTCGGGNRTAKGAQAQSILMSVLQSCRHKGIRVIDIVTSILRAPDNTPVPLVNPER